MTIAISIKVNDGLVLAADSASTFAVDTSVWNIYNNTNKIFNLRKGLPIGAMTWGLGGIGAASISTLAKDLRIRFTDPKNADWYIDPDNYTIADVATKVRRFFFDENYSESFPPDTQVPELGLLVAGYSSGETLAEQYEINMIGGRCDEPRSLGAKEDIGAQWRGQIEALHRLVLGYSQGLPRVLHTGLGVPEEQLAPAIEAIRAGLELPFVVAAMPFQDAIELAEFFVGLAINFSRFVPGPQVVGGPIEVAGISKHEGFKWIKRKFYYDQKLNPREN